MRIDQPLDDPARQARRSVVLAYKGPRRESRLKVREEHQVDIPDPQAMIEILRGLHYSESFSYEKRRKRWRLEGAEITIDELPLLGFFMEVEAADEDTVERLLDRLGFQRAGHITTSYLHLLFDHFGGRPQRRFISFNGA
jgi:predicted adenylyl cyclase CyaB